MLQPDHDIELADGGTNDLANVITRCIPHHEAKSEERRMARTATTTQAKTRTSKTQVPKSANTAQLPDPPAVTDTLRVAFGVALVGVGVVSLAYLLGYDYTGRLRLAATVLVAGAALVHVARWTRWRRTCEEQRVYERLSKPAGILPHAARRRYFKVNRWAGLTPKVVTVTPGADFDPNDPRALETLAVAFAGVTSTPRAEVRTRLVSRGRLRVGVLDQAAHARAPQEPTRDDAQPDAPAALAPENGDTVTTRVRDALAEVLEGCTVEVTNWHPDGAPARVVVSYPAAATKAAREGLADLPVIMGDLYEPRTKDGRWRPDWNPEASRYTLTDEPDPLAPVVPPAPVERQVDLWRGVNIGVREGGAPWLLPLLGNQAKHTLVVGESGAGKGSVLWGITRSVTCMITDGTARLWALDPKNQDLVHAEPLAYRCAYDPETSIEVLREVVEAMGEQADRLKRNNVREFITPTREAPFNLVMVDELANLTVLATPQEAREVSRLLGKLLTMGRSAGFVVVAATQNPSKENLKLRDLFTQRIGLSLAEAMHVDMVLGRGARANGAWCDLIDLPGICYVTVDGEKGHKRTRAARITDEEIARITARPQPAPEHGARAQTGEQLALPEGPRGGEPVPVGEVLSGVNTPDPEPRAPILMRALLADDADLTRLYLLPDDEDPVRIVSVEPDEDDPDTRLMVTYVYDGEKGERCASFERDDEARPV